MKTQQSRPQVSRSMDRDQGHMPDPQVSSSSVSRWVSLLKGRPRSRILGPACPTGNVQGVPVAVEAERDTAADEDHLLPIPVADKSSCNQAGYTLEGTTQPCAQKAL